MKKILAIALACLMLSGCGSPAVAQVTTVPVGTAPSSHAPAPTEPAPVAETKPIAAPAPEYTSRFDSVTTVILSDSGITVEGNEDANAVYTSHDIIYYEDRDAYESGNPYGEGEARDKHGSEEAAAHTVVNITAPGAYLITGTISAGQIRVDLGEDAYENSDAVVELILQDADITCTVAPAILFLNTYECDGDWSADTATSQVDTTCAGANLILQGKNTVSGSHVAKIFKDNDEEKKLWKQDGAIYSYMSLNVFGPGSLALTADNEGLDTELHLTIQGGDISICSDNDGINTNEDGVSVTTINGGTLRILAGLGEEGDGIDSNGYLVINGGTVIASANPRADAGMDSDMGSYINGGTVIALGSSMDGAESDSRQVTMNLRFAQQQSSDITLSITKEDGTVLFSFEGSADPLLNTHVRSFSGAIVSCPDFQLEEDYYLYMDGIQMNHGGAGMGRGGFGRDGKHGDFDGHRWDDENGQRPERPEGESRPQRPEGTEPVVPDGENPRGGSPDREGNAAEPSIQFRILTVVNTFSGIAPVSE